ncbi:hypothetical protein ACF0H5_008932 [Mactra antiquata]
MDDCCVHHAEFGVEDGEELQTRFQEHYKFSLVAKRVNKFVKQWVLRSGSATVLVTQRISSESNLDSDKYYVDWQENRTSSNIKQIDSVFNIALKVKDVSASVERLSRSGCVIVRPVCKYSDEYGNVTIATVKSCIGNVVHTLIEDEHYSGVFLPDFVPVPIDATIKNDSNSSVTHFDHVTFACVCGDSERILSWYSNCFGMKRFLINRDEDVQNGFVIDTEDIGLRLKAFEYWKCAESGISTGNHPESIKFVVAEALPNQGPNQVDTFLQEHHGAGIQHIGLHTFNIIGTVSKLKENGVQFAEPPYTYYTEVGKLEEIKEMGQDVDILRENGILVDAEADSGEDNVVPQSNLRYLLQKFTKPLFKENTFFLEVIQRVGARGFGSGNITALWRSVQAYMNNKDKETASS